MAYISKEEVKTIRTELKKQFPSWKFSVTGGNSSKLSVEILESNIDFASSYKKKYQNCDGFYEYDSENENNYIKDLKNGYASINHDYIEDRWEKDTAESLLKIKQIITGCGWYDKSDAMTDYFDIAYYINISIGKWRDGSKGGTIYHKKIKQKEDINISDAVDARVDDDAAVADKTYDLKQNTQNAINEIYLKMKEMFKTSLSLENIERAYRNTSFSSEKRAKTSQKDFENNVKYFLNENINLIKDDETLNIFTKITNQFFKGYTKRFLDLLNAKSNCFSAMITGAGNFNNTRHKKMNDREHKKSEDYCSYFEYMQKKLLKELTPKKDNSIDTLKKDLKLLQEEHNIHLELNKIQRKKIGNDLKIKQAKEIINNTEILNDFIWNIENNSKFFTTNSNARIKNLILKIEKLEEFQKKENKTIKYILKNGDTLEVVENYEIERYQILFENIPSEEVRKELKKLSFRWSPKSKAWQQHINNRGAYKINMLIKFLEAVEADDPQPEPPKPTKKVDTVFDYAAVDDVDPVDVGPVDDVGSVDDYAAVDVGSVCTLKPIGGCPTNFFENKFYLCRSP